MAWSKGVSGNKKGRPVLNEVEKQNVTYFKQQLKRHSVPALEELFELMTNSINQDIRYKCATYILDRCYGKNFIAECLEEENKDITIHLITKQGTNVDLNKVEQEIWKVENETDWLQADYEEWNTDDDWGETDIYLG